MSIFKEVRQKVQHAVGHDEVIKIHPLDMAELMMDGSYNKADIIRASASEPTDATEYVIIGDKVYHQTTSAVRTGNTIN